jgi:predicted ribosome quality control (RQC) complex YloA/Tae2 family protein
MKDLLTHQQTCTEQDLHLLKYGRHFRLSPQTKLIVGRTDQDNREILKYHNPEADIVIHIKDYPSPLALIPNGGRKDMILLAAAICVGYSKVPKLTPMAVLVKSPRNREVIQTIGIPPEDVKKLIIK